MSHGTHGKYTPLLSNRLYDGLKYFALVILPAFSALYFGLGDIWNLPKVTEVIGTIAVLDTVLGMVLRSINVRYNNSDARFDGQIDDVEIKGDNSYSLDVQGDPAEVLETQKEVLLKVGPDETPDESVEVVPKKPPRKRAPRKPTPIPDEIVEPPEIPKVVAKKRAPRKKV